MRGRARRLLLLALAALITLSVSTVVAAPSAQAGFIFPVGWARLKYEATHGQLTIGPNRYTGYGKYTVTGFRRVYYRGHYGYRATYTVTNHTPSPLVMTGTTAGTVAGEMAVGMNGTLSPTGPTRTLSGFCWPWNNGFGSGCAGWNNISSWDMGDLWNKFVPKPMDFSRVNRCEKGAIKGGGIVVGKGLFARLLALKAVARSTPEGFAISVIAGCVFQFWSF